MERSASPTWTAGIGRTHEREGSRQGWLLLVLSVAAALLVASLPYLYAYLSEPADRVFVGIVFNVPDNVQYLSWMRDHRVDLLVPNRMTAEPNAPLLFNLLWLILGRVEQATGLSIAVLFHALRAMVGAAMLVTLYWFCGRFTQGAAERWSAYLMIAFGGGLGWIWVVEKYLRGLSDVRYPLDLYVAEPNLFFNLQAFPHFVIAALLIVLIFSCFLLALERHSVLLAGVAAALGLLLTLQHAYDLLIIGLVPAGTLLLIWLRGQRIPWFGAGVLLLIGAVATPPAAYFALLTSTDPLWREVLAQFDNAGVFTPSPPHLLVLLGLPLIITIAGVGSGLWRGAAAHSARVAGRLPLLAGVNNCDLLLWSWLVVGFLLLYIPTDFQIHMLNTWQIPVALIAARTLHRQLLVGLLARRRGLERIVPLIVLIAVLPTNLYLIAWRTLELSRHSAPFYLTSDEDAALTWLDTHAGREDVVFSGIQLGQFVPARSDARTWLGHWAQTVDFYSKRELAQRFFSAAMSDAEREALLRRYAVTYILHGGEERSFGAYDPGGSPRFEAAFRSGDVTIYRVHTHR